jgi:hypothetical protein
LWNHIERKRGDVYGTEKPDLRFVVEFFVCGGTCGEDQEFLGVDSDVLEDLIEVFTSVDALTICRELAELAEKAVRDALAYTDSEAKVEAVISAACFVASLFADEVTITRYVRFALKAISTDDTFVWNDPLLCAAVRAAAAVNCCVRAC